jgi:hypothetical protein
MTISYDVLGRVTLRNGPLDDALGYDATATSYYTSYDPSWPYNLGQVQTTTRYIGTASANTPLITTYAEYDLFGIPHRITSPNGSVVVDTVSADGLVWTTTEQGDAQSVTGTSTVGLNASGTVRYERDAMGVCTTYEYSDSTGYVGAPTVIRRSNSACGVVPIDQNSDEVEIRTYVAGEPDRLASITRKRNGVVELSYAGLSYDRDRRIIQSATIDSSVPFAYGFTDVLPSGTTAPGGPAPGSWKTEISADSFGRPATLSRFLTASNKQTYTYSYLSPQSQRPTAIARGFNGTAVSTSFFTYDDFGRLIEARVPEAGRQGTAGGSRYEYDVRGRLVKSRVGTATTEPTTSSYHYDSLDRLTLVDHDLARSALPMRRSPAPASSPL